MKRRSFVNFRIFYTFLILLIFIISFINCVYKKEDLSTDLEFIESKSTKLKLKYIAPGTFYMGATTNEFQSDTNEYPQHLVKITQPFYIGVYEVTQEEFEKTMGFNPSTLKSGIRLPVETLSWFDVIAFCNKLSKKDGLDTCYKISNIMKEGHHIISANVTWLHEAKGYRLPTEAEWEFACRSGTYTAFPFGKSISSDKANYGDTKRGISLPVDSLTANNWGLYNIVGNVFEWVWDYYGLYTSDTQTNPIGPDFGKERVRRSGAYTSPDHHMRSAVRHGVPPGAALFHMGFRLAKSCH